MQKRSSRQLAAGLKSSTKCNLRRPWGRHSRKVTQTPGALARRAHVKVRRSKRWSTLLRTTRKLNTPLANAIVHHFARPVNVVSPYVWFLILFLFCHIQRSTHGERKSLARAQADAQETQIIQNLSRSKAGARNDSWKLDQTRRKTPVAVTRRLREMSIYNWTGSLNELANVHPPIVLYPV